MSPSTAGVPGNVLHTAHLFTRPRAAIDIGYFKLRFYLNTRYSPLFLGSFPDGWTYTAALKGGITFIILFDEQLSSQEHPPAKQAQEQRMEKTLHSLSHIHSSLVLLFRNITES
jgi:hypothetical protein